MRYRFWIGIQSVFIHDHFTLHVVGRASRKITRKLKCVHRTQNEPQPSSLDDNHVFGPRPKFNQAISVAPATPSLHWSASKSRVSTMKVASCIVALALLCELFDDVSHSFCDIPHCHIFSIDLFLKANRCLITFIILYFEGRCIYSRLSKSKDIW